MFHDTIENRLSIENKTVTYKWLAYELNVPTSISKKMLASFVRAKKSLLSDLHITFLVSFTEKENENKQSLQLISGENFEEAKKKFGRILSIHVFSLQLVKNKDQHVELYQVDKENSNYLSTQDNDSGDSFRENRLSAIANKTVKISDTPLRNDVVPSSSSLASKTASKSFAEPKHKSKVKKKAISCKDFFGKAKASSKKTVQKEKSKSQKVDDSTENEKTEKIDKKEVKKSTKPETEETKVKVNDESIPIEKKEKQGVEKMDASDSEEEEMDFGVKVDVPKNTSSSSKKKRKRKSKFVVSDEESEDEGELEELKRRKEEKEKEKQRIAEEKRLEKQRKKEEQKAEKLRIKNEEAKERKEKFMSQLGSQSSKQNDAIPTTKSVLVERTFVDDNGYLVTKCVYDDVELTEKEKEAEAKARAEKAEKAKQANASKQSLPKKRPSDVKSGAKKKKSKQTSMLSFFKKA